MAAGPYPYERWPRVSKREAYWVRNVLRALPSHGARAEAEASALCGVALSAAPAPIESWSVADARAAFSAPLCALWLEFSEGARALPVVCALPPELGALLVDRVLGGNGDVAHVAGETLDDLSFGVLAYLGARICAALGAELRVCAPLADAASARALIGEAGALVLPIGLRVAGVTRGILRVFVGHDSAALLALRRGASSAPLPAGLRTLPMSVCAHAGRAVLRASELRALSAGDVVVPEHCSLTACETGFAGTLELHVIGSRRQHWRASAQATTIAIESAEGSWEDAMTDAKRIETQSLHASAAPLAGDAPIELCLEIARFSLPLEELSALRPGEVLGTGRAIGQSVSLCAAGRTLARGELVELDGEVGVRILELVR
jgi:type III secretion system YscQ/HrcQ family protein